MNSGVAVSSGVVAVDFISDYNLAKEDGASLYGSIVRQLSTI